MIRTPEQPGQVERGFVLSVAAIRKAGAVPFFLSGEANGPYLVLSAAGWRRPRANQPHGKGPDVCGTWSYDAILASLMSNLFK